MTAVSLAACGSNTPAPPAQTPAAAAAAAPTERTYMLERVDDAAIVQLYADGFQALPLKEKALIWHLTQAAIAGRDIFYDQRYAHGLAMRDVLEAIVTHPAGVDPATLGEITRYIKLFWINSGPFNNLTARKFVLQCTPEALAAAGACAGGAGVLLPHAVRLTAVITRAARAPDSLRCGPAIVFPLRFWRGALRARRARHEQDASSRAAP